jgi:RNA polymerase sigma-70 factor (ECF subfamily)
MQYNEREHILACQGGNTEAFGHIYDRHVRTIYNFIYYKVFDKETSEDLTSQTFFKALRNVSSVDPDRPILSWLYKIAHNSILDHYRGQRHMEDIDDFWDIKDEDVDIVVHLDNEGDMKKVKKYLKTLSSIERDIIFMRVWQELPYQAIAEIIGKSEANCKMIYSRSIKKLKSMIPLALLLLLIAAR